MPEGDTIFRVARTLNRALAGRTVTRFDSVFSHLTRVDDTARIRGRTIDRVDARGKHLLIWFSGDLVLRTHMRMHGSWHIYRPGERWQRSRDDMRIVLETPDILAVAFMVPVAEFMSADAIDRAESLRDLGPDLLRDDFDPAVAVSRLQQRGDMEIADALLDQRALAGIGNIYKSETLFATRINPFTPVSRVTGEQLAALVARAVTFMRANIGEDSRGIATCGGLRRTTGQFDPGARFWVYGRAGKPCRRCGTPIARAKQGPNARSTYWCPRCQPQ
jgi:endonuclease-8